MTLEQGKPAAREQAAGRARDPAAVNAVIAALAAQFGNRLVTSQAVREQHANTTTWIENEAPDAVVFPQTTADVQAIVRICAVHRVPVIPFGTGTSLEGHINAPLGGVSVDFRDMNKVLAVNARGPRLRGRAGHHAQAAQRASARPGPVLSARSRRRRVAWRHGRDALLRHQRGALRHHEGQCARAEGRAGERRAHDDRSPRQEVLGRLRPHPADRGLRGHAGRDHRAHAQADRHSRGDLGRRVPVPIGRDGVQRRDRDHPVRHPGGAHRAAR